MGAVGSRWYWDWELHFDGWPLGVGRKGGCHLWIVIFEDDSPQTLQYEAVLSEGVRYRGKIFEQLDGAIEQLIKVPRVKVRA